MTELATTARQRVDRIKTLVGAARADIIESYRQRDWVTLGFESWDAMCAAEFGTVLRLSIEDRQRAVEELRNAGMSTPAIGAALGVSDETVRRDITSTNVEVETITGIDGRQQPASRPRPEGARPRDSVTPLLDSDPDVAAARLRHQFHQRIVAPLFEIYHYDPEQIARIAPDHLADLDSRIAALRAFRDSYAKALQPSLRILKES